MAKPKGKSVEDVLKDFGNEVIKLDRDTRDATMAEIVFSAKYKYDKMVQEAKSILITREEAREKALKCIPKGKASNMNPAYDMLKEEIKQNIEEEFKS